MATTKFTSPIVVAELLLEAEECATCGVVYALTRDFLAARKRDGNIWYCPNGHQWQYTKTDLQREREARQAAEVELRKATERLESERGWSRRLEEDLTAEKKDHAVTKGKLTKTRNRIAAGVCPDCHRHFENLERHMTKKHAQTT